MMGLTLWIIIISYIAALVAVGRNVYPWKRKLAWWGVLLLPLVIWLWDWPIIRFHHELRCRQEGGLKVLIEPEKADRLRLDGESQYFSYDERDAKQLLQTFYPKLKFIEAKQSSGPDRGNYFIYSITSNSTTSNTNSFEYTQTPINQATPNEYVLTKKYLPLPWYGDKRQIVLTRNNKTYASSTWFRAIWNSGGLFPDEFQCHSLTTSNEDLIKLILN